MSKKARRNKIVKSQQKNFVLSDFYDKSLRGKAWFRIISKDIQDMPHHEHHKRHHHESVAHQLKHIYEAASHALEHLNNGEVEVAKDIIAHLISSVESLEAHADHL